MITYKTIDEVYLDFLGDLLYKDNNARMTRNGNTTSSFGKVLTITELEHGHFPMLHARKMYPKGIFGEMAAFLNNPNNVKDFKKQNCNYWGQWADANGALRIDYGNAWNDFNGDANIDDANNQIQSVVTAIKEDPMSRRHVITGWNPSNLNKLSLPCCHLLYQWYVNGDRLEMVWYQRSVDVMVGLPSDIVLAAIWNIIMASETNLKPGKLVFMLGDCHVYENHEDQAQELLHAEYGTIYPGTNYTTASGLTHGNFNPMSIHLDNYVHGPQITLEVNK